MFESQPRKGYFVVWWQPVVPLPFDAGIIGAVEVAIVSVSLGAGIPLLHGTLSPARTHCVSGRGYPPVETRNFLSARVESTSAFRPYHLPSGRPVQQRVGLRFGDYASTDDNPVFHYLSRFRRANRARFAPLSLFERAHRMQLASDSRVCGTDSAPARDNYDKQG